MSLAGSPARNVGRYAQLGDEFAQHDKVDHSREEYGYTDRKTSVNVNTNTIEGYYSIFKRGMKGVYQHCSEKHLHRYTILPNSISAIQTALRSALRMGNVRRRLSKVSRAVVSRIAYLTKRTRTK